MHGSPTQVLPSAAAPFDPLAARRDFPILQTRWHGKPLVYLDNGATTQKPIAVLQRMSRYYGAENANIHRGVYELSQVATEAYERSRRIVARFINAPEDAEVIFTRGTTEAINLVAATFARRFAKPGEQIILSHLEHHSNIVPWQLAAEACGAVVRVIPINDAGELLLDEYRKLLASRTAIVAVNHVSNSLGTINDVRTITQLAHAAGAKVLIDGAQHVAHAPTDVRAIGCDFYAFSGHKLFGPTGIGVLWGRRELLEAMPPWQGGGDMIETVTFEKTTYAQIPNKFEAGTPHIAGAVGLAAAIEYVQSLGFANFGPHEEQLLHYATQRLLEVPGLRIIGTAAKKASVLSFVVDGVSSMDIGTKLDAAGIAVRTGHHCCMPVMQRFGIPGTTRASLALYNTREDVDALVDALKSIARATGSGPALRSGPASESNDTLAFPESSATSPAAAADELAETFEFLGDRDARNQYILELGEKLMPMPGALKTESTRVHGCMSTVHLYGRGRAGALDFLADSDAHIVRGLIGVLQKLFAGQRAADILAFDVEAFFRRIGLDQFITTQRRNGLAGMVKRIRTLAEGIARGQS